MRSSSRCPSRPRRRAVRTRARRQTITVYLETVVLKLQARLLVLFCAICTVACSKSSAASASTPDAGPAASSTATDQNTGAASAIDCTKVFAPADVAGILTNPAKVSSDTLLGPGGCEFDTGKGAMVTTRVGSGEDAQYAWHDVSATTDGKYYTAMAGIGDAAFWREAGSSAWLIVKKGEKVCQVELGISGGADEGAGRARGTELAKKMGALCTKAFAAT